MHDLSRPVGSERSSPRGVSVTKPSTSSGRSVAAGFVLIGGRSRRFGSDKAMFRLDGIAAADAMANKLAKVCDGRVRLIGRDSFSESTYECVPDARTDSGPLSGVLTALDIAESEIGVIVATDLWNLSSTSLRALLRAVIDADGDVDVACAMSAAGRVQPLCSAWRIDSCTSHVRDRLGSGEKSMFGALEGLRMVGVFVEETELLNVNDPVDLDAFLHESTNER